MKNNLKKEYWLYGKHSVSAALNNPNREIHKIITSHKFSAELLSQAKARNIIIETVDSNHFRKLLPNVNHQSIAALVSPLNQPTIKELLSTNFEKKTFVILDQLSDPYNLGAVLRTSAAFNVGGVIITKDNSVNESAVVAKAASGALEQVPLIVVTNLADTINYLKQAGFWIAALDGNGNSKLSEIKDINKLALVIGGEDGIRSLIKKNCDFLISIPISDKVESLNLSVAASIAIFMVSDF